MNIKRSQEILNELQLINDALNDGTMSEGVLVKKAIPLWVELDGLREHQIKVLEIKHQELVKLTDEDDERIMELESIPMTENAATKFIHDKGLQDEFSAYIEDQLTQIGRKIESPPKVQ